MNVAFEDFPAQINRKEAVALLPHEVVGVVLGTRYPNKESIPTDTLYIGIETLEYLTVDKGIRFRWNGTAWESMGIVYSTIVHTADGELDVDLTASQFTSVNLEANVTSLTLTGGRVGETYRIAFTQDDSATPRTLKIAPDYPVSGTPVLANENYLYTTLNSTYPIRRRVYKVPADYTTDNFDNDRSNGDLVEHILFPDAVTPLLSYEPGSIDVLLVTVLQPNLYVIIHEFPNM